MEPRQYRKMWLSDCTPPKTGPEYEPIRQVHIILEELGFCNTNIGRFNDEWSKERAEMITKQHIEHEDKRIQKSRLNRVIKACECHKFSHVLPILKQMKGY